MKTIIKTTISICSLTLLFLASCSKDAPNKDKIVKDNFEEHLKPKLNDPDSYEFIEINLIDSVSYEDNIQSLKKSINQDLNYDKKSLKKQKGYKEDKPFLYNEDDVAELKNKIDKNKILLSKIDSISSDLGSKKNEIASYTYIFKFRGNNAMGAKVINQYAIQTGTAPDYKLINIAEETNEMLLTPNNFPGYDEIMAEIE